MKTSYKKNRPFDFKLIDLVEPNQVIYKRQSGFSNYETMKAKNEIWDKIAREMGRNVQFCLMRWNNLRYQFQKELKRTTDLCPKLGVIRGSTWPYLERLRFLQDLQQPSKPKPLGKRLQKKLAEEEEEHSSDWEEVLESEGHEEVFTIDSQTEADKVELTEEHIIDGSNFAFIEEVIENSNDVIVEDADETVNHQEDIKSSPVVIDETNFNLENMKNLLAGLHGENRARVERRILAYLLKCQLRVLMNEDVDDLII